MDQKVSEYGHFLRSVTFVTQKYDGFTLETFEEKKEMTFDQPKCEKKPSENIKKE